MYRVACMIWYLYCDVYMYSSIGISVNIGRKFLGHSISVQLQHTSTLGCFRLAVAESLEKNPFVGTNKVKWWIRLMFELSLKLTGGGSFAAKWKVCVCVCVCVCLCECVCVCVCVCVFV